ncbi:MAG: PHP domain-containing protein [Smithella sp.]|jgi:PHP family Zn ribbon phosphoesterase|nr:PHP domain-containing protein [Smithella sp.]
MLNPYNCDLHIHTCLSPCAELDMHPQTIVQKALEKKIDMIAVSDHNASANARFVMAAAAGKPLEVIPAMEITTSEEVHLLALFRRLLDLEQMQVIIDEHLFGENDEERFGLQAIVNELGEVEGFNNQLLIGATDLPIDDVIAEIHRLDGLAIAAHIDRESFSVLSQLGFIDDGWRLDALEISKRTGLKRGRTQYPQLQHYPFITSSDAHFVDDIGTSMTRIMMETPGFDELKMALSGQNGRLVVE